MADFPQYGQFGKITEIGYKMEDTDNLKKKKKKIAIKNKNISKEILIFKDISKLNSSLKISNLLNCSENLTKN